MGKAINLTKEQLAAQCIMPRLDTEYYHSDSEYKAKIIRLAEMGVCGFCLFGGKYDDVILMINELQSYSEIPLIFSADMENGLPMRFEEGTDFPHHMALGRTNDLNIIEKTGNEIARESANMGVKWNLAPVADINLNELNPVINIRAFGNNSDLVSECSAAYIRGTQSEKVVATAKHFPGHGDTDIDSHCDLPVLLHSEEKIRTIDLKPFERSISEGVKSIMTGHLSVPSLDDSGLPASLSERIISILKEELKFNGIIITDALDMKAITNTFKPGEASFLALNAGNDIALLPEDPFAAIEFVTDKAQNDIEFHSKLMISAEKIIDLKRWCGLIPFFAKPDFEPKSFMQNQKFALVIADSAISNEGDISLIPLKSGVQYAGFAYLNTERDLRTASRFFTMLAQATENDVDFAFFDDSISNDNIEELALGTQDAEFVIFPVFLKGGAYTDTIAKGEAIADKISRLSNGKPSIAILFGSPYIKDVLPCNMKMMTYSDSFASLAASVVHLTGRRESLKL